MAPHIDFSKLISSALMAGDSPKDTALLRSMLGDAESYLRSFEWCTSIKDPFFGLGVGGVVAVFLFHIVTKHLQVDEWLWVIVGDLPPAYLVVDGSSDAVSALEGVVLPTNLDSQGLVF